MLRVELSRAAARRLVAFLLLGALGAVLAISVGVFATHHKERPPALETPRFAPNPSGPPFQLIERDRRFHYTDVRESSSGSGGIVTSTSAVFLAISVLVGASLVGAEYRYGTMATLLTWEPRRPRVLFAKLLAAAVVAAVAYVVLEGLLALALVPVAVTRGTFAGADAAFARGVAGEILRGAGLAGGLAAVGACLATLGRNTSAALGGLFVYLIGVEAILRAQQPGWARWFLIENLAAVLTANRVSGLHVERSVLASALLLAVYLAGLVAVTTVWFTRRDVT